LPGNGSCASLEPSSSVYPFSFHHLSHTTIMDFTPIYKLSIPKGDLLEPLKSLHPILTDGYEIRVAFIAMVREQTLSGKEGENPYIHIREFEQLCSCLNIPSMKHETIKWKLFLFSLSKRAKQWYAHNYRSVKEIVRNFDTNFVLLSSLLLKLSLFVLKF
jgi:hypothetical protein